MIRGAWSLGGRWLILLCAITGMSVLAHAGDAAVPPASTLSTAAFKSELDKYKGRVLVVNVWATWCVPCLREIPDLLTLQRDYSAQGVALIGIAVDDPTPGAAEVERFRQRYFPKFLTYARQGPDLDELTRVIDPGWNEVVPTTYIISRDGLVIQRIQGKRTLEQFRALLQPAL
ncbi:MAG: TlpA disulfide reductase family protein [Luminiphilus sp.]